MEASVEIDRESRRKMEQTLTRFSEVSGKTVEQGIQSIAKIAARRLAMRTQRWGMDHGPKWESAIEKQVSQVWIGVNLGHYPLNSNMKQAHNSIRRYGHVPHDKIEKRKGDRWQFHISERDKESLIRELQKKLGRAKAAWITAGQKVDGKPLSRIPKWISRHVGSTHGKGGTTGKGLDVKVEIENDTYLNSRLLPEKEVGAAALYAMRSGFRTMQKIIDKEVEKANRA